MSSESTYGTGEGRPLIGLDRRRRPESMRDRIIIGLRQSAPFSSLQRRIIFFNLLGLAMLVFGVLYLNEFRSGLIDERIDALRKQGRLIAIMIGQNELERTESGGEMRWKRAEQMLAAFAPPTGLRAGLYDTNAKLVAGTGKSAPLRGGEAVAIAPDASVPLQDEEKKVGVIDLIGNAYGRLVEGGERAPDRLTEMTPELRQMLIMRALEEGQAHALYIADNGELVVSVFLPVLHSGTPFALLEVSTEGSDISEIVRNERVVILQVFLIASLVSVGLSVLLANTIASPIRRLANAVDPEGTSDARPINPDRIEVPDMTRRTDEIGDLSAALKRMTDALYRRIEAIESFAADVAHEIKNPLTSLRSAVETMEYAKTPEQRQRLLDVIVNDVGRLDRLVTDISNASRLDAELVRERMEPFDLHRLVLALAAVAESQGERLDVAVVTKLPNHPLMTRGLEGRIAQVITNVTDNALSFSPSGTTITIEGQQLERGIVRLTISDQGPGIPEDNLGSIFERFYSERPAEGFGNHSGLGLSICKQIVEAHGGKMWAENIRDPGEGPEQPAKGARFVVELPG